LIVSDASLLSPHWYRVAYLKPRLRSGVRIARQQVRGQTWYVLTDPVSGRHHRFNGAAYALIAACDGRLTIDDVWAQRVDAEGDDAPTQAQAIEVFAQAFGANLLGGDIAPDAGAVMRAQGKRRAQQRRAALNPLSFRLPLWDPDRFLTAHLHRVRWCFGAGAKGALGVLLVLGTLLVAFNLADFSRQAASQGLHGRTLILLWIAYPLVKALHEMAHAFAVKAYGGAVHEMGVTVLMLTPVPYVDASAAIAFEDKRKRVVVGAAGIAVEWLLSSAALALWLLLEPGFLHDAAFAVACVGGVSTLLLNGNPLLRFDGYHVLCDALELPNLAQRSTRWWQALAKRVALGGPLDTAESARGAERAWLIGYAPASWAFRVALTLLLALALADWNAWIGLVLLALSAWWMVIGPALAALRWLFGAGELHGRRGRAIGVGAVGAASVAAITVLFAPLPHRTLVPGVVWLPDEAIVRPAVDGFIDEVLVRDGQSVQAGTPLLRLSNEPLRQQLLRVQAELQQAQVEQLDAFADDALRAALAGDRLGALRTEHDRLAARVAALEVRAGIAGRVAIEPRHLVAGRHLAQGQLAAHVLPPGAPQVHALVAHEDIALVRDRALEIRVALAHGGGADVAAQWLRDTPRASTELITPALGERAGGPIALDPKDGDGRTALQPRFEVELQLPEGTTAHVGARAWVRFGHGQATLAELGSTFVRRAFLRHFRV
jgi:putative peptide zinc metalloprotease protein